MAKPTSYYVCTNCGSQSAKWVGRCPDCGEWNTMQEEAVQSAPAATNVKAIKQTVKKSGKVYSINELESDEDIRYHTGLNELDRVLGGGIVKGSVVLLGGDPGIGKSTILLQMCATLDKNLKILYATGEESARQIKLRASRLGVYSERLFIMSENDTDVIVSTALSQQPDIVIIDSIQTMFLESVSSSPGSVSQVRECTAALTRLAKGEGIPVFIVGHVNKEGAIAGPKVMEHMVDAVLYFEGERQLAYRILRAVKNRYGSTNEIGVFEMGDKGLCEVMNPSMMFLSGRPKNVSGTAVVCILEGTRPLLAEVQALISSTSFPSPHHTSVGVDYSRLCLLLAVLEKRGGLFFSSSDVYVNVVGGIKLDDPSSDLGVLLALASGLKDLIIPADMFIAGEVGLAGEIRNVSGIDYRIAEAKRLGFTSCIIPYRSKITTNTDGMEIFKVRSIYEAIDVIKNKN